jgi:hypothetical protein
MKTCCLSIALLFCSFFYSEKAAAIPKSAVLIVGNDAQDHAEGHLNSLADIFMQNGITVYKFYFPNARWSDIKAKATTCSFFIYTGHGFANGGFDGEFGGLYINEFVHASDIAEGLHFKNRPLIIYLNACGSHGTSAGDPNDIGVIEAHKRITDTALPFFMVGAGGYFATSGLITGFLKEFLSGKTLTDCYKSYVGDWEDIVKHKPIVSSNALNQLYIGISSAGSGRHILYDNGEVTITESNPKKRYYGNAYIGPLNFTVNSISQISK